MIERYTRPQMGSLWEANRRFDFLLQVEIAVAEAQADLGVIPKAAAKAIASRGKFDVARINELEKTTKHDIIAFVTSVAENVGDLGRFVHFALTSSDVLDTALSLQIKEASGILDTTLAGLETSLKKAAKKYAAALCVGRTHGIHAEPTTFGLKMAGFLAETQRNRKRVKESCEQASRVKLSGAVGTYSALGTEFEKAVSRKLKMQTETLATQVIPRDRHAELMTSLALLGAGLERLAVELRHLQRTEVDEVEEGFKLGQKGSSAMPHKKNPISSENITGLSRILRANAMAALENVALWHERDISHSSVERVIFPDSFILADYMASRMADIIDGLVVKEQKMLENLQITKGRIFSSHVLLALIQKGMSREDAYKIIQSLSHGKSGDLKQELLKNPQTKKLLSVKEVNDIFSGKKHQKLVSELIERVL